jgi:hypothetical protein
MPDYQPQIVILDASAETSLFEEPEEDEMHKILTGQGFPAKPTQYYKQRHLKQTFNFITTTTLPDILDVHSYPNDDHMRYI